MNYLIDEDKYFRIEHCHSCTVPGYLIVSPVIAVTSINGLPESFQERIGFSLAVATGLIEEIIRPVKIYCAQFGEAGELLHFHVFPRTEKLTAEFLKAFPGQQDPIHGPVLLDWARTTYKNSRGNVWSTVSPTIAAMRKRITAFSNKH